MLNFFNRYLINEDSRDYLFRLSLLLFLLDLLDGNRLGVLTLCLVHVSVHVVVEVVLIDVVCNLMTKELASFSDELGSKEISVLREVVPGKNHIRGKLGSSV